jgi:2-polyprenyl-3-methyl-5-hydroxy-6-metoxy-1,4-benzoquinol methylase
MLKTAIAPAIRTHNRTHCYLCDSEGSTLFGDLTDRLCSVPGRWGLRRCTAPTCGLVWLDPVPVVEDIGKLYPSDYVTHTTDATTRRIDPALGISAQGDTGNAPVTGWHRQFRHALKSGVRRAAYGSREGTGNTIWERCGQRAGAAMGLLPGPRKSAGAQLLWLRLKRPGERLLDVGCGNGEYLDNMRRAGWEVTGVEPDEESVRMGRSHFGLEIHHGVLEDVCLPEGTFDVITMQHVVEHLSDPVQTLQSAYSLLRPGGRLVVVTPNVDSLARRLFSRHWASWDPPRHLFLFSNRTLRRALTEAGFNVRKAWTPTRTARWVVQVSRQIRRYGKCTNAACPQYSLASHWGGRLLRLAENALAPICDVGEELVMVATRPEEKLCREEGKMA